MTAGYALMSGDNGATVGALRMLRLVRLLTFIKGVKQLRVIVSGLITGLKSVSYIVILLILVIYIFAIIACLFFGGNDPARFGTVATAMLSLFQISTAASWTSIVYTTWFGCDNYLGDPYGSPESHTNPSMIRTVAGTFEGYRCDAPSEERSPIYALFFFSLYIVLTAWVIMSLFIGVITMGMFESFNAMKEEDKERRYQEKLAANNSNSTEPTALDKLVLAAIADDVKIKREVTPMWQKMEAVFKLCRDITETSWFSALITSTIIVVGIFIGVEADQYLSCERYFDRDDRPNHVKRCEVTMASYLLGILSQAIFTFETVVKLLSEGYEPKHYFRDSWNCMDFFIVVVGFIEMTPLAFIFEAFPVVILRLLRLLRVFRLAKALPKLRAIVEALMQGFSAVGWMYVAQHSLSSSHLTPPSSQQSARSLLIRDTLHAICLRRCVLIIVFNYIIACMSMLFLGANDPFHFGTIPRAMFNVLRLETLDSWDQILYIAMFGCDGYPGGYPFAIRSEYFEQLKLTCKDSQGLGWMGAFLLLFIVIFGAFVLPTVLIGIVAISYDEATKKAQNFEEMMSKLPRVEAESAKLMPGFLSRSRQDKLYSAFSAMDADDELSLDIAELTPFFGKAFKEIFDVKVTDEEMLCLFHIMDTDGSTELGFAEFAHFVVAMKKIEHRCRSDLDYARKLFETTENKFFKHTFAELQAAGMAASTDSEAKEERNQASSMDQGAVKSQSAHSEAPESAAPVDPYVEGVGEVRPRPPPDATRTLRQVIERTCDAIATRFLGPYSSVDERAGLSELLFQSVVEVLLLAKHTDEPIFGTQPSPWELEALVERAISIALTRREERGDDAGGGGEAVPGSAALDGSKARPPEPVPWNAFTAPPPVRIPSTRTVTVSALPQNPLRPPVAAVQRPTMSRSPSKLATNPGRVVVGRKSPPRRFSAIDAVSQRSLPQSLAKSLAATPRQGPRQVPRQGPGQDPAAEKPPPRRFSTINAASQQSLPEVAAATKARTFEDRYQERKATSKRRRGRRASDGPEPASPFKSHSPRNSPDADPVAVLAVAWRHVLEFLTRDASKALQVEALFEGPEADSGGAVDVDFMVRSLVALGADLSAQQLAEFRKDCDGRGTGRVTIDELLETVQARSLAVSSGLSAVWDRFWQHLGSSGATVEGMFAALDHNGNKRLSVAEVAALLDRIGVVLSKQQVALFVDSIDAGGDGFIDLDELSRVAHRNRDALCSKQPPVAAEAKTPSKAAAARAKEGGGGGFGGGGGLAGGGRPDSARAWRLVLTRLASNAAFAQMVEDLFDAAADDGRDGRLDIHDLTAAFRNGGVMLAPPDVRAFFADCDVNGDGALTLEEFLRSVKRNKELQAAQVTF